MKIYCWKSSEICTYANTEKACKCCSYPTTASKAFPRQTSWATKQKAPSLIWVISSGVVCRWSPRDPQTFHRIALALCCLFQFAFSVAVMNTMTQSNWREARVYLRSHFHITVQPREKSGEEVKLGIMEVGTEAEGTEECCLLASSLIPDELAQDHVPKAVLPTLVWAPPSLSWVTTIPHRCRHRTMWSGQFHNWASLFPGSQVMSSW